MYHSKEERNLSHIKNNRNSFWGVFLLILGTVLLLNRLEVIPEYWMIYIVSWQSFLILIGFISIIKSKDIFPGIILIIIGLFFLLPQIFDIPVQVKHLSLPVILIVLGLLMILKHKNIKINKFHNFDNIDITDNTGSSVFQEFAFFGGGKKIITSKNLKGGSISTIFGGLEIDMTEADFENDVATVNISCIFGGVTLIVKPEWDVQMQVASILGGFNDKRKLFKPNVSNQAKRLIIKGSVIFGGGEIKAY
jgi:predicted membrane protein